MAPTHTHMHQADDETRTRAIAVTTLLHDAERRGMRLSADVQAVVESQCLKLFPYASSPHDAIAFSRTLKETAIRMFRQRRYREAERRYKMASLFNPNDVTLVSNRATCMFNMGRFEACVDICLDCLMNYAVFLVENIHLYLKLVLRMGRANIELRDFAKAEHTPKNLRDIRAYLSSSYGAHISDSEFDQMVKPYEKHLTSAKQAFAASPIIPKRNLELIEKEPEEDYSVPTIRIPHLCRHILPEGTAPCNHALPTDLDHGEECVCCGEEHSDHSDYSSDGSLPALLCDSEPEPGLDMDDHPVDDADSDLTANALPDLVSDDDDDLSLTNFRPEDDSQYGPRRGRSEPDNHHDASDSDDDLPPLTEDSEPDAPGIFSDDPFFKPSKSENMSQRRMDRTVPDRVSPGCASGGGGSSHSPKSSTIASNAASLGMKAAKGKSSDATSHARRQNPSDEPAEKAAGKQGKAVKRGVKSSGSTGASSSAGGFKRGFLDSGASTELSPEPKESCCGTGPVNSHCPVHEYSFETDEEVGPLSAGLECAQSAEEAVALYHRQSIQSVDENPDWNRFSICFKEVMGKPFQTGTIDFFRLFGQHIPAASGGSRRKKACDKKCAQCFARKMWKARFVSTDEHQAERHFVNVESDPRRDPTTYLSGDLWQGTGYYASGYEMAFDVPGLVHGVAYIAHLQSEIFWRRDKIPMTRDIQHRFISALGKHFSSPPNMQFLYMILFVIRDTVNLFDIFPSGPSLRPSPHSGRTNRSFQFSHGAVEVAKMTNHSHLSETAAARKSTSLMSISDNLFQNNQNWAQQGHVAVEEEWVYRFLLRDVSHLLMTLISPQPQNPSFLAGETSFSEAFEKACEERTDDDKYWKCRIVTIIARQRSRSMERDAVFAMRHSNFETSELLLSRAITTRPHQARLFFKRADVRSKQKRWNESMLDIRKAKALLEEQRKKDEAAAFSDRYKRLLLLQVHRLEGDVHLIRSDDNDANRALLLTSAEECYRAALKLCSKKQSTRRLLEGKLRTLMALKAAIRIANGPGGSASRNGTYGTDGAGPSSISRAGRKVHGGGPSGCANIEAGSGKGKAISSDKPVNGSPIRNQPGAQSDKANATKRDSAGAALAGASTSRSVAAPQSTSKKKAKAESAAVPRPQCALCKITFCSRIDYDNHMAGRRHRSALAKAERAKQEEQAASAPAPPARTSEASRSPADDESTVNSLSASSGAASSSNTHRESALPNGPLNGPGPSREDVLSEVRRILLLLDGEARVKEVLRRMDLTTWGVRSAGAYVDEKFGGIVTLCGQEAHQFEIYAGADSNQLLVLLNREGIAAANTVVSPGAASSSASASPLYVSTGTSDRSRMTRNMLKVSDAKSGRHRKGLKKANMEKKDKRERKMEENTCGICFDRAPDVRVLPCSHEWCESCISQNIGRERFLCPYCNQRITHLERLEFD